MIAELLRAFNHISLQMKEEEEIYFLPPFMKGVLGTLAKYFILVEHQKGHRHKCYWRPFEYRQRINAAGSGQIPLEYWAH